MPARSQPDVILLGLTREEYEEDLKRAVQEAVADLLPALIQRALLGPYLTPKKVCELTGWSPRKLAYLREQRRIPYRQEGRSILFKTDDVLAFIETGSVPATNQLREDQVKTRTLRRVA
jgi:excisionase family DNA binding protein